MSAETTKMSASDYSATTKTSPVDGNTTIEIPKEKWSQFLNDFSKRRFGWGTKVEVISKSIGDQLLSEGLILNGIACENKSGNSTVEISLGDGPNDHQTHSIANPVRISYLSETDKELGVLEIEEEDGTKTLISLVNPMPIVIGYASYESVSVN